MGYQEKMARHMHQLKTYKKITSTAQAQEAQKLYDELDSLLKSLEQVQSYLYANNEFRFEEKLARA